MLRNYSRRPHWWQLGGADGHTPIPRTTAPTEDDWAATDRTVGRTYLGDTEVSTVFLMLDRAYDDGPPVLFETLVFGGDQDGWMMRYHTWDDAERGHAATVAWLQGAGPEPE